MINLSALFSVSNLIQIAAIAALGYLINQQYGGPPQQHRSAAAAAAAAAAAQSSNTRGGKGPALSKKKGGKGAKGLNPSAAAGAAPDSKGDSQPAAAAEEEVCYCSNDIVQHRPQLTSFTQQCCNWADKQYPPAVLLQRTSSSMVDRRPRQFIRKACTSAEATCLHA
jgi:hypothetical protein